MRPMVVSASKFGISSPRLMAIFAKYTIFEKNDKNTTKNYFPNPIDHRIEVPQSSDGNGKVGQLTAFIPFIDYSFIVSSKTVQ